MVHFELRVSQLSEETSQEEVAAFVEEQTGVKAKSVKLLVDKEGKSKGVCFLKFESQEELEKALAIAEPALKGASLKLQQAESQEARRVLNKERRQKNQRWREPKEGEEDNGEARERRRRPRKPR